MAPSQNKVKTILVLQAVALAAGNYVGWTTIAREITAYCNQFDGSLWRLTDFSGNLTDNPLTSACFWGSVAFAVSLVWTVWVIFMKDIEKVKAHVSRLWWLLLGGTLFALANNIPILYNFYTHPGGASSACSAGLITNPYLTSCFLGFIAFLTAFIFASWAKAAARKV
jgi:hypothetical protein